MSSMKKQNRTVKLKIESKDGPGPKYQPIEEFYDSYFRDNYYHAFQLTQHVIEQNRNIKERKKRINQDRLYNIIAFWGKRGTGKTSVMYSFLEALQNNGSEVSNFIYKYEQLKGKNSNLAEDLKQSRFVCLEEIDASLLDEDEDILEAILAKMLQKFRREARIYERNALWSLENEDMQFGQDDIIRQIEKIYRDNRNLLKQNKHEYDFGESSLEVLNDLTGSLTIREAFKKLVPIYLEALCRTSEAKNKYLVITIDDLDVGEDGYKRLEKIHRYLMVPGVIICMAVSGKELQEVCEQHFGQVYRKPEELSMKYLEKVIPFSQRIYLPSLLKSGLDVVIESGSEQAGIKSSLLRKIVQRTRVCYDGCGLKTHFYEVSDLRTLVNLYCMFNYMEQLPDTFVHVGLKQEECKAIFDNNIEKIRNDVLGRIVTERLQGDVEKVFENHYNEDMCRRGESFVKWIIDQVGPGKFSEEYQRRGYSYGELLRGLYILGREKRQYKPLIHCVLAMDTVEMTRLYMYAFRKDEEDKENEKYMNRWRECIAGSICGSWGNHLLPKWETGKNGIYRLGYLQEKTTKFSFMLNGRSDLTRSKFENCKAWIEKGNLVEILEQLFMFITQNKNRKGIQEQDIEIKVEGGQARINLAERTYTYDVLGFAINSMEYQKYFDNIQKSICEALRVYCESFTPEQENQLVGLIRDHSMRKEYENWYQDYKGMALPVYSTDIMYNMLKRVKQDKEKKFADTITSNPLVQIRKMYGEIREELSKEDKFYRESDRKTYNTNFVSAFNACPFIENFEKMTTEREFRGAFEQMIVALDKAGTRRRK